MLLYNFDQHIGKGDGRIHYEHDYTVDVFRGEYPPHVKNIAECFRNIARNPKRWQYFLRVHKISRIKFKKLTGLYSITEERLKFIFKGF